MKTTDFQPFPKMARLSRECIITEKIDGTNAQILIEAAPADFNLDSPENVGVWLREGLLIRAGSRNKWLAPGKATDNFGFAAWVLENVIELLKLGPGRHFGEWWGSGIQRGYGQPPGKRIFSLFNTIRWVECGQTPQEIPSGDPFVKRMQQVLPACCRLVPALYRGPFRTDHIDTHLEALRICGSDAAPGFMNPEGIVVFHTAANFCFKKTLDNDALPKSLVN